MFYIWSNFGKWNQSNPSKHFGEEPLEWKQYRQIQFQNQVYWKIIFTFETLQVMLKKLKVEGKTTFTQKKEKKKCISIIDWMLNTLIEIRQDLSAPLNSNQVIYGIFQVQGLMKISQPYDFDLTTMHFHSRFSKN